MTTAWLKHPFCYSQEGTIVFSLGKLWQYLKATILLIQISLKKVLTTTFVKLLFADLLQRIGVDNLCKLNY